MLVQEKTHHINVTIDGEGADHVVEAIRRSFPNAQVFDDEGSERWDETELAADIRARKTPGKLLRAYRERAGLTITKLAQAVGTKYPNISAMENDRRAIGLSMARKLASVLDIDYKKLLPSDR